jgi:hypothetical protein
MRRRLAFVSASLLFSAVLSASAPAADSRFSAGAHLGADLVPGASLVGTADAPIADFFVRFSLNPSTFLEFAVSYRHYQYSEFGGRWGEDYSLTQVPIFLGLHYVILPLEPVSPLIGAGVHCSFTRDSYSTYRLYPNSRQTGEGNGTIFGLYGHFGLQVRVNPHVVAEIVARYVLNPVSSGTGEPSNQNYLRLQAGASVNF